MKTAIWAAVSTVSQAAPDKVSIQLQIQKGREFISARDYKPAGEYIVPGESRTAFISLSHAEDEIPQLKKLLDDAKRGRFDVLWVYDLNRFRNLMLQVFEVLADYGIQIYNHDDPETPVLREHYTHERINARRLNIKLHDIISGQEINTLQKHYREKMPVRITQKRLHAGLGLPPYGYRKPPHLTHDRNAVLEIVPEQARILHQMKDWFLIDGLSLTDIAARLNAQNEPSPRGKRWWYSIVRYLLANPFYAGTVTFGATKRNRDKRLRTVTRTKGSAVSAVGLHQPIWDQATHQRLLDEIERRAQSQPGISTRALTRLLKCECGAVMWAQTTPAGKYWRCSSLKKNHSYINNNKALDIIIPTLTAAIEKADKIKLPEPKDKRPALQKELRELKAKEKRWLDLYEDGTLDKDTLNKRLQDLKTRLDKTSSLIQQLEQDTTRRQAQRNSLKTIQQAVHALPEYIRTADPKRVNATLHAILEGVTVHKNNTITLHWR